MPGLYGGDLNLGHDHGFHRDKGYSQVEGKGEELNRLYGEYNHLREMAEKFNLPLTRQSPLSLIGSRVRA